MSETLKQEAAEAGDRVEEVTKENPIVLQRIHKREDGGVDVSLSLTKMQTYILIEFAIMTLVAQGLAIIQDVHEGAEKPAEEISVTPIPAATH